MHNNITQYDFGFWQRVILVHRLSWDQILPSCILFYVAYVLLFRIVEIIIDCTKLNTTSLG
jgi:hypothetical protein